MLHYFQTIRNWIRHIPILFLLLFTFSIFFHNDTSITQDLGRHLTIGKIIVESHEIPRVNLFSYTNSDFPFFNHHWGSEVIFFLIHDHFGINGLIIGKVIILLLIVSMIFLYSRGRIGKTATAFTGTFVLEILRERTEIRPEIFGYLFFTIMLLTLYKVRFSKTAMIWILPVMQFFWVNMHISFIFGLAIYGCFLFDRIILKKITKTQIFVGLLLVIASLLNPFGIDGLFYPFKIFSNYGYSIVENQSPFFLETLMANPTILYFKIAISLLLFLSPPLFARKFIFPLSAAIFTGFLSFAAIRHFPFFALSLFYPLGFGISQFAVMIENRYKSSSQLFSITRSLVSILCMLFILSESILLLTNRYYESQHSWTKTGLGQVTGAKLAVDTFEKLHLSGPIFNNFDIGSYLIYRLYPRAKVFVDGRPEAYPATFFQKIYIPMQEDESIWERLNEEYKFQTIIFSVTDITPWARQFLGRITKDPMWKTVYLDDYAVILTRKAL